MRYEYVKSMKMAGYLMQNGFKLYGVQKDKFNPIFDVYLFRGSDELTSAMMKYINCENGDKYDIRQNSNTKTNGSIYDLLSG